VSQVGKKRAPGALRLVCAAPLAIFRRRGWPRQAAIAGIIGALIVATSLALWATVRKHVQSQPEYLVSSSELEITPRPAWIHADVRAEVIRDAGLPPKISILDEGLFRRLSQAFALHPWVESVKGVRTSYPAHIEIDLVYRRPVAMVEVYGGLLPIDSQAVLLPTEDFSPQEAQHYPRISGVATSPLGPMGTSWGDPAVEAAVKLATFFDYRWEGLRLHHVQARARNANDVELELVTRGATNFIWGSAPGQERTNEAKADVKLKRLEELVAAYGTLDATPAEARNLRSPSPQSL